MNASSKSHHTKKSRGDGGQIQGASTLLTISETAAELRCSVDKVYDEISAGRLRAVDTRRPGAKRPRARISRDAIADYIASLPALGVAS